MWCAGAAHMASSARDKGIRSDEIAFLQICTRSMYLLNSSTELVSQSKRRLGAWMYAGYNAEVRAAEPASLDLQQSLFITDFKLGYLDRFNSTWAKIPSG
jgi:hypothetical protein